jgi:hypothetical protein
MKDWRDAVQTGELQYARSKRTEPLTSRSMFGVRTALLP